MLEPNIKSSGTNQIESKSFIMFMLVRQNQSYSATKCMKRPQCSSGLNLHLHVSHSFEFEPNESFSSHGVCKPSWMLNILVSAERERPQRGTRISWIVNHKTKKKNRFIQKTSLQLRKRNPEHNLFINQCSPSCLCTRCHQRTYNKLTTMNK